LQKKKTCKLPTDFNNIQWLALASCRAVEYGYSVLHIYNATHLGLEQISVERNGSLIDSAVISKDALTRESLVDKKASLTRRRLLQKGDSYKKAALTRRRLIWDRLVESWMFAFESVQVTNNTDKLLLTSSDIGFGTCHRFIIAFHSFPVEMGRRNSMIAIIIRYRWSGNGDIRYNTLFYPANSACTNVYRKA
jgi:hypothetical protein